jgi:rod shape-determining protein MreC
VLCFILVGSLVSITADLRASLLLDTIGSLVSSGFYPVKKGLTALKQSVYNVRETVGSMAELRQENKDLKKVRESLFSTVVRARELEKENERLRDLLGFARKKGLEFAPVEVIGGDATSWFSTVTVDKRGNREIEKDMCVVTDKGVVGRILSVEPLTARVLLLSDSNSRVGALVQRTRDRGIVQGNDSGGCLMKYLDPMADVERGDLVVTSGDSLIFPKGLAVGVVTKVERERGDFLKWAEIEPSVEFSRLEEAFVILP